MAAVRRALAFAEQHAVALPDPAQRAARVGAAAPLFQHVDGKAVTILQVVALLRRAGAQLGLNAAILGGHSLRRGATQAMFEAGYERDFIKSFGRWTSDAVYRYLDKSFHELHHAASGSAPDRNNVSQAILASAAAQGAPSQ